MSYLRGVRHGAIIGAVLALLYAPDAGAVTRRRLARWLGQLDGSMEAGTTSPADDNSRSPRNRSSSGRFQSQSRRQAGGQ
jgi:gas vesicle protein